MVSVCDVDGAQWRVALVLVAEQRHDAGARERLEGEVKEDQERHQGRGDSEGRAVGAQVAARQTVSTPFQPFMYQNRGSDFFIAVYRSSREH